MKWMHGFLVLVLGLAMGLGCAGCSDDDEDGLVGTWRAQSFNGQTLPANASMVITLRDNGTWSATTTAAGVAEADSGTWSAENGVLTVFTNGENETEQIPYSLSGDTLTMGGAGEVFVLKRQ